MRTSVPASSVRRRGSGRQTVPVTHSTPAPAWILAEAVAAYAIGAPVACELVWSGLNDTYRVTTDTGRYMARVYRAGWRSATDVAYEVALLNHLARHHVSVAAPLVGRDGASARAVRAPEGERQLALFENAPGSALRWKDETRCRRAGRLLAQIHNAADDFDGPSPRFCLDAGYLIAAPLGEVRPHLADQPAVWEYLEQFAAALEARLAGATRAGLDWGVCHGDYGGGNIHVADDGELTVFDFDISGPGWRAYDLASIKLPTSEWAALRHQPGPLWTAFLEGYREVRPLCAAEVEAVPLFRAARHLWGMGLQAANAGKWGSNFMNRWYFDAQLKFFRLWESEQQSAEGGTRGPVTPPRPVRVTHSTLDSAEIGTVAAAAFDLGEPVTCQFLRRGLNDIYLLESPRGRRIARVYRARWRSVAEIDYELDLLEHLAARHVCAPRPIRADSGARQLTVSAPEGNRQMVVFDYIEGQRLGAEQESEFRAAGFLLGELHNAADGFRSGHSRPRLDLEELVDASLAAIEPQVSRFPAVSGYLKELGGRLRRRLGAVAIAGLDWGVCHGDFYANNLLTGADHRLAVLDFDYCGEGWRAFDLTPVYTRTVPWGKDGCWAAFLAGYGEARPLAAVDLAAVPLFGVARQLFMLRMFAINAPDWGNTNFHPPKLDGWLGSLRRLESRWAGGTTAAVADAVLETGAAS